MEASSSGYFVLIDRNFKISFIFLKPTAPPKDKTHRTIGTNVQENAVQWTGGLTVIITHQYTSLSFLLRHDDTKM